MNATTAAVIATLRHLQGFPDGPSNSDLRDMVEELEVDSDPGQWSCCPFCHETVCDSHCPFAAERMDGLRGRDA